MLRSIGSSLVAKSSPGGKLRDIAEQAITTPQVPGKGAIGSISRAGLEEPMKREVPAGSEKVVGVQPIVESQAGLPADVIPSEVMPPAPIPEGMSPSVNASVPQGNRGQALFQGGVGGSSGGATAGASRPATKQVSQGVPFVGYTNPNQSSVNDIGVSTQIPRTNSPPQNQPSSPYLGGGANAGGVGAKTPQYANPVQKVVGGLGKIVSNVAPALGNQMQSWGGIRSSGQNVPSGNRAGDVRPSNTPSFSQGVSNQLRSVIQNLTSKLRSWFK